MIYFNADFYYIIKVSLKSVSKCCFLHQTCKNTNKESIVRKMNCMFYINSNEKFLKQMKMFPFSKENNCENRCL